MLIDIVYNIALLLSISVVYVTYPFKAQTRSAVVRMFFGLAIGLVGLLIMSRPAVLFQGIVFDGRSILLGVSGMFFGAVTTIIAAVMMIIYRIVIGGGGMWTGISVICSSCAIGVWWHHKRYRLFMESHTHPGIEVYLVGLAVHILMLASMALMPRDQLGAVYRHLTLPILVVYPIGFSLLARLLFSQVQRIGMVHRLEESEQRFKTIFEQAPMGITVTDSKSGTILDANHKFLDFVGLERTQLGSVTWMAITHPEDLMHDELNTRRMVEGDLDAFTMDKRFIRPDGSARWVSMAVTFLQTRDARRSRHLCMITDITERKQMEEALRYANTHDALTGVFNRSMFERLLRDLDVSSSCPLAILTGDVNGLKMINDAFGWASGNDLLIALATSLRELAGDRGHCARIGGDEFALLLPQTAEAEAWEMVDMLQKRESIKINTVEVSISYGVAVKHAPEDDLNDVVKQAENVMNRNKLSESPSARSKTIQTIITTLHEKNRREELHSRRVSVLGVRLAESLGMNAKEIAELRTIGLLHDIGKIAIDESVLNKEGRLTELEWEAIKRHPETGWRILGTVGELGELALYVLSHHERIDGTGYPQGLRGDEIPLQSKIIAIVDAYDAMTAIRSYRTSVSDREAAAELKRCAGTQFDTDLARLFVEQILQLSWDEV